jgi:hypothetical protein
MVPLPPVPPAVGWRHSTRLPRDHYVRLAGNDYSVHPSVVGRRVDVVADLEQVQAFCDRRPVARHARCWARHQTITDPAHRQAAAALRRRPAGDHTGCRDAGAAAGPDRLRPPLRPRPRPGGGVMTAKTGSRNIASEIAFLTRSFKAPSLAASVDRLAERARAESWSHEEFLAACLQREVAAREAHGGEGRIRAAKFPARKSLEEFDFDHQRSLSRDTIAHLGTLDFITGRDNVVFLGPPGTGKTHLSIGLGIRVWDAYTRLCR